MTYMEKLNKLQWRMIVVAGVIGIPVAWWGFISALYASGDWVAFFVLGVFGTVGFLAGIVCLYLDHRAEARALAAQEGGE